MSKEELVEIEVMLERTSGSCYYVQDTDELSPLNQKEPISLPISATQVLSNRKNDLNCTILTVLIPEWLAIDRELI